MLPKRKASELVTLYKLKPNLRDSIVEGVVDKFVITTLTDGLLPFGSSVYSESELDIDTIDVSGQGGARERVIALCRSLNENGIQNLHGIVDRDLDQRDSSNCGAGCLLRTEHTSLDFHLVSTARMFEIVALAYRLKFSEDLFSQVSTWSRLMFAIRIVRAESRSSDALPSLRKIINSKPSDVRKFAELVLEKMDSRNGSADFWRRSATAVFRVYDGLHEELADSSNFHDLEDVFGTILVSDYGVDGKNIGSDWLHRLLRAQLQRGVIGDPFIASAVRRIWGVGD
jgi:hypothetical protein